MSSTTSKLAGIQNNEKLKNPQPKKIRETIKNKQGYKSIRNNGLRPTTVVQVRSSLSNKNPGQTTLDERTACDLNGLLSTETAKRVKERVDDLSAPGLCSALLLAKEIQAMSSKNDAAGKLKLTDCKDSYKTKVLKKTNVPFTKHIFKDLIDLHISDEEINAGKSAAKCPNFGVKKDNVFELSEYYKPDFSTEFLVKPKSSVIELEKVQYYNGSELYDLVEGFP